MRAVNLLPPSQRRRFGVTVPKPVIAGAAILVLGSGLGLWSHSISSSTSAAEHDLTTVQTQQTRIEGQLVSYRVAQQRSATLASERQAIEALTSDRVDWERLIRNVATVLPPQVWLTGLKAQTPAPTAAAPGAAPAASATDPSAVALHLDGMAFSQTQVALTMARLAAVPGLGQPTLTSTTAQVLGTRRVVSFSMDIPIDSRAQGTARRAGGHPSTTNPGADR
jgi:Tfp pilus assembly protein PilN